MIFENTSDSFIKILIHHCLSVSTHLHKKNKSKTWLSQQLTWRRGEGLKECPSRWGQLWSGCVCLAKCCLTGTTFSVVVFWAAQVDIVALVRNHFGFRIFMDVLLPCSHLLPCYTFRWDVSTVKRIRAGAKWHSLPLISLICWGGAASLKWWDNFELHFPYPAVSGARAVQTQPTS